MHAAPPSSAPPSQHGTPTADIEMEMRKASPEDRPLASLPNEDSSPPPVAVEGVYIGSVCVCGVIETDGYTLIPKGGNMPAG